MTNAQKKSGKPLEQLVYSLEQALAQYPNVSVEAHKKIRDCTNGKLREHDVFLTIREKHHEIKLAIECRDRSRPITVNQVEGFWKKCQDTGINQGVIVSPRGFYSSARTKATFLGVKCFTLEEATSVDWIKFPTLRIIQRQIRNAKYTIFPVNEDIIADLHLYEIFDSKGAHLDKETLVRYTKPKFDEIAMQAEELIGPSDRDSLGLLKDGSLYTIQFIIDGEGIFLKNNNTEEVFALQGIICEITYEITSKDSSVTLIQYVDGSKNDLIANAAIVDSPITVRGRKERLMIVNVGDHKIRIALLPGKENE